jgi:hypothetical protein
MAKESHKPAPTTPNGNWWLAPTTCPATTTVAHGSKPQATASATSKPRHAKLTLEEHNDFPAPVRCPACSRAHPADAFYCYFDGKPLFADLQQRPAHIANVPFPSPFCFSRGQACANFNQLALTCGNLWEESSELLRDGIWTTFFASLGRLDLANLAKQAAKDPDPDRGLSQLIGAFPADPQFLRPAKLRLAQTDLELGSLNPGNDYTFDLVIENQGMLLLHGIVVSNFDWLVFGEQVRPLPVKPEPFALRACEQLHPRSFRSSEKFFQTRLGCTIPVRVLGCKLRAGLKPLRGEIIVDTNGGAAGTNIRVTVPIRPFPKGVFTNDVLAGVRSPRELAVKAREFPKEAGLLFQQGAVKAWYASNGWSYPIDCPDGVGEGAVQQFFEAMGLTSPPQLKIDQPTLEFHGMPGESLASHVTVYTKDRKPVYAQAWSDQDWVKTGPLKYKGTRVQIPVKVVVPADRGSPAQAKLMIQGNARQRFVVPVSVTLKKR